MTRIDSDRLQALMRSMAVERNTSQRGANQSLQGARSQQATVNQPHSAKEILRERLRTRLRKLRLDSPDFEQQAPLVTIKEVLSWELGEAALAHPEFAFISTNVVTAICQNEQASQQLRDLIQSLIEDGSDGGTTV